MKLADIAPFAADRRVAYHSFPVFADKAISASSFAGHGAVFVLKLSHTVMNPEVHGYTPEGWRADDLNVLSDDWVPHPSSKGPNAREQSRLLDLLGKINYKILTGNQVYIQAGGVVYKTLYGGYWRSVFTGIEHYLLRCVEIQTPVWLQDKELDDYVDLPITYANGGWIANGHSLSFILSRE